MKRLFILFVLLFTSTINGQKPIKVGVIGLTHTHVHWIFTSEAKDMYEIVGIVEPSKELAQQYAEWYNFPMSNVFSSMEELFENRSLEAVTAFGNIYDHLSIVEFFAPKGIHIMVEKPLAVSLDHAKKMQQLALKHNVHLLTNYETTWYPTNLKAYQLVRENVIGDLRKVVVRDGHRGPKKIGINKEFLAWLTDPKLNGGGAITDFGCYGANLLTWLQNGKRPNKVTAITKQLQEENNPEVDDEAIILLEYDTMVAIIEASWNWPIGRKDMELYGLTGAIYADNRNQLRVRIAEGYDGFEEEVITLPEQLSPNNDPFAYLAAIVNKKIKISPYDLSSLENNMIVMEILEAAKKSAKTGKSIKLEN